jgi:ABC-2 type transport system permease protein
MTLWRLEWLRMVRTYRILVLPGLFILSGLLGPALAKILPDLVNGVSNGIEIILPEPTPYEGIVQYLGNVDQLGLVGITIFAAMSLGFDAKRELAIFLRSRATVPQILAPRYVTTYGLAAVSTAVGAFVALGLTRVILGPPPSTEVLLGATLFIVYVGFVIAMVGVIASLIRSVLVTSVVSILALIISGLLRLIPVIGQALPGKLSSATIELMDGGVFDYWPAIAVTLVATAGLLWIASYRLTRREI